MDDPPRDGTHILAKRVVFRYESSKGYHVPAGEKWEECFCRKDGYWQPWEGERNGHPLNTTDTFNEEIIKDWRPLPT